MATEGQPETRGEKRLLWNAAGSLGGMAVGALAGTMILGRFIQSQPMAALVGAIVCGVIGFLAVSRFRTPV